ncbi:hypothetical protein TNIN_195421 [Trichonephila inaurata madagascariensis]|uniref:Uncharacterized protein n=1 Tax=Trichonephila inaurata madagascariensis TaxID=2747483 RepID=A0A8X6YUS6_9ARAC|nr:hypothetical protein TNIN_195421 [Trichonephila inaurata madagascariensis]
MPSSTVRLKGMAQIRCTDASVSTLSVSLYESKFRRSHKPNTIVSMELGALFGSSSQMDSQLSLFYIGDTMTVPSIRG